MSRVEGCRLNTPCRQIQVIEYPFSPAGGVIWYSQISSRSSGSTAILRKAQLMEIRHGLDTGLPGKDLGSEFVVNPAFMASAGQACH